MSDSFFLFLNSADVDIGTSANFQVNFDKTGIKFGDESEVAIGLDYVIFPNLIYPIRANRSNRLVFNEGAADLTATLNEGNYDSAGFATELQTRLNAAGTLTYTVSISSITNRITISATGSFSLKFRTNTATGPYMWKVLGFAYDTNTSSASSQTGSMPVRLDSDEYYVLNIDNLQSNNVSSAVASRSLMDIIPMKSGYGDIIYHQFNEKNNFILASYSDLKYLRIRITDSFGIDIPMPDNGEIFIKLRVISTQNKYNGQT